MKLTEPRWISSVLVASGVPGAGCLPQKEYPRVPWKGDLTV